MFQTDLTHDTTRDTMTIRWRYDIDNKQDRQYTYHLTLGRIRATTDAVENQ